MEAQHFLYERDSDDISKIRAIELYEKQKRERPFDRIKSDYLHCLKGLANDLGGTLPAIATRQRKSEGSA